MAVVNAISYMRPMQLQRVLISRLIRPCLAKGGRIYVDAMAAKGSVRSWPCLTSRVWRTVLSAVCKRLRSLSLGHISTCRSTACKLLCYHTLGHRYSRIMSAASGSVSGAAGWSKTSIYAPCVVRDVKKDKGGEMKACV